MNTISKAGDSSRSPSVVITVFTVWSFIMICRPQDYLTFLDVVRPALLLGLVAATLYFFSQRVKMRPIMADSQMKLYGWLVIVMVLSLPFSYYQRLSLKGLIGYGSVVLFVFLFYRLMNGVERIRRILFVYCIGIAIYGLSILTQGTLLEGRIAFGTMFDPNDIAFYMISFITFNLLFISGDNTRLVRYISLASFLLGLLIIVKTGSRGGFIALMAVFAFLLFNRNVTFKVSVVQKCVLVLLAIISLQFVDFDMGRFRTILDIKDDYNSTSEEGRIAIWKSGVRMMATHPLAGVGFNLFPEGLGREKEARGLDSAKWQTAHNSLVQVGAETGLFGFLIFLLLSLNAYRIFAGIARDGGGGDAGLAKLGVLAQAGFIGHFIAAMFLSQAYSIYWAFYIVLSATMSHLRADVPLTEAATPATEHSYPSSGITDGARLAVLRQRGNNG